MPCRRQDSQKLEAASFPATLAQGAAKVNTEQFSSFEDMVAESKVPVLVDFYAPWCGPCELMSRVVAVCLHLLKMSSKTDMV